MKVLTALLVSLLVATTPGAATAAPGTEDLARLVHAVATAEQELHNEQLLIGGEREKVNRMVVSAEQALDEARDAHRAEAAAAAALAAAERNLDRAQQEFDDLAGAAYMHGPFAAGLLGGDPVEVIENAVWLQAISLSQRVTAEALTTAQQARRDEHRRAGEASMAAERARAAAADRRDEAARSLADAQRALQVRQHRLDQLVAERDAAQAVLDAAVGVAGTSAPGSWRLEMSTTADDPATVIARMMSVAEQSARDTAAMGRAFLAQFGAAAPVQGRYASELVISRALSQRGIAYSWGGGSASGPTRGIDGGEHIVGFDCSGLMMYAFAGVGIALPHYSGSQYEMGVRIPVAQMRRGDVVFYGENGAQHVALYLGDNMMVEAPNTGAVVRVAPVRHTGMAPYAVRYIDF